jgi:hypothetical protein
MQAHVQMHWPGRKVVTMANNVRGGVSAALMLGATPLMSIHCHTVPICSCSPTCSGGLIAASVPGIEGRRVR